MLSQKEQQVLNVVTQFWDRHHYAPSNLDIAHAMGLKTRAGVVRYLKSLQEKGYLIRQGHTISIVPQRTGIPLLGKISAGLPLEAYECEDEINVLSLLSRRDCFLLRVNGDSMQESGILDGDMVFIRQQMTARNGEIIVALLDHTEATLKEYQQLSDGRVCLIAHNCNYPPQIFDPSQVIIQGVYTGIRIDAILLNQHKP